MRSDSETSPSNTTNGSIEFSLEVFPPKDDSKSAEKHWAAIDAFCELKPKFISITCGALGNTPILNTDIANKIQDKGGTPAIHFTALGKTPELVRQMAEEYKESNFTNIIALRGDYPIDGSPEMITQAKKPGKLQYARELVEILTEVGDFDVSVASYPEKHPEAKSLDDDIAYLKEKLDAGANRSITQFFFDPEIFLRFRDRVAKAGIDKPVVPGILPILNIDKVAEFGKKCDVQVPQFLLRMYEDVPRNSIDHKVLAMNILSHQITRLLAEGVRYFHFYTLDDTMLNTHICKWLKEGF